MLGKHRQLSSDERSHEGLQYRGEIAPITALVRHTQKIPIDRR